GSRPAPPSYLSQPGSSSPPGSHPHWSPAPAQEQCSSPGSFCSRPASCGSRGSLSTAPTSPTSSAPHCSSPSDWGWRSYRSQSFLSLASRAPSTASRQASSTQPSKSAERSDSPYWPRSQRAGPTTSSPPITQSTRRWRSASTPHSSPQADSCSSPSSPPRRSEPGPRGASRRSPKLPRDHPTPPEHDVGPALVRRRGEDRAQTASSMRGALTSEGATL